MPNKNVIVCVLDGKFITIENDNLFFSGYRNMYLHNKDGYGLQVTNDDNLDKIKELCFKLWSILDELNKEIKVK